MPGPRSRPQSYFSAYATKGKASTIIYDQSKQLYVYNVRARNNTAGAISVGIVRKLAAPSFRVWQYVASGSTYTEVTAAVAAGTATNIFTGTNNDGFIIQSKRQIGLVGFTISTAQSSGVWTYKYSNTATSFATLTTLDIPTDYSSTGDNWIVARPGGDSVVGGNAALDQTMYSLQVISTTAPAGAVAITNLWVGEILELYSGVPQYAAVELSFPTEDPLQLQQGESIIPYFATANAANDIGIFYVPA